MKQWQSVLLTVSLIMVSIASVVYVTLAVAPVLISLTQLQGQLHQVAQVVQQHDQVLKNVTASKQ